MSVDQIVERYVKLRDKKAEMKKAYEASVAEIQEGMDRIENYLINYLQEEKLESARTAFGTVFTKTTTSATVGDRDTFKMFLAAQDDPYVFLDLKANKTAVEEYSKEHKDVPPGINWTVIKAVGIRRS